jgi:hypothetical protein
MILGKLYFINLPKKALLSVHEAWRQERLISRITPGAGSHVTISAPPLVCGSKLLQTNTPHPQTFNAIEPHLSIICRYI